MYESAAPNKHHEVPATASNHSADQPIRVMGRFAMLKRKSFVGPRARKEGTLDCWACSDKSMFFCVQPVLACEQQATIPTVVSAAGGSVAC